MPLPALVPALGLIEIPFPRVNPVALQLPGGFAIRWYGLAFLAAFAGGYLLARRLARSGFLRLPARDIGDLLFYLIVGVIVGGRLGYALFYDFPSFAANPTRIVRIWEGGLAFHGGLSGAIAAAWLFARSRGVPFLNIGDTICLSSIPGLFTVRIANFINGELFGRVAGPDVPWAMRFPTDPLAQELIARGAAGMREREAMIEQAWQSGLWQQVRPMVPLRHPSQLYEAFAEGILLGLVLWGLYAWMRRRRVEMEPGTLGGVFMLGYALIRITMELFRQPDAQFTDAGDPVGTVLGPLTMGQTLSLVMAAVGIFLIVRGLRRGLSPAVPEPPPGGAGT
ncbi:MAG TPA: prolipoprotein diacylglyceryl transferase [Longimicrobium sp.]|nr:prolipoprotein diacylglyceryl transferase [Longimicrobium sp.]